MQATREKLIHYQKFVIVMRSSGLFLATLLASIGINVLIYYRFERVPIPVVVVCLIMLVYTLAVMMRNLALQPFIAKQRVLSWYEVTNIFYKSHDAGLYSSQIIYEILVCAQPLSMASFPYCVWILTDLILIH